MSWNKSNDEQFYFGICYYLLYIYKVFSLPSKAAETKVSAERSNANLSFLS